MRFLVDADMPRSTTALLRDLGNDVVDIRDIRPPGTEDSEIYSIAREEERIIITRDLDFGNIITYPPGEHPGIIVLRVHLLSVPEINAVVKNFLKSASWEDISGALVVLRKDRFRIRKASSGDSSARLN